MSEKSRGTQQGGSAGGELASAREELNLSVAEVARHLKLSPAQVEALEAGAYERLPGRVFVRGFLRNYAKLVGVDPEPLVRRLEHELPEPRVVEEPPPPPQAVMPTGERSRWPLYAGIAGTIIAALAAYEFGFNSPEPTEAQTENAKAAPDPTSSASAGSSASAASSDSPGGSATDPGAAASASPPVTTSATVPTPGSGSTATAGGATQPQAAGPSDGSTRALHFRFEEESWVEVRDADGRVIFTKLNKAGTEERVTGLAPLRLVVGNARGVRLTADDQPVDLAPYTGASVARLTLK
jgi:cytoskeleton protein RodZ